MGIVPAADPSMRLLASERWRVYTGFKAERQLDRGSKNARGHGGNLISWYVKSYLYRRRWARLIILMVGIAGRDIDSIDFELLKYSVSH